jgi:hypothetical protein
MHRTTTEPGTSPPVGHVQRKWNSAEAERHIAMASEHGQLVEAVQAMDGVSKEQAEFQVSAFEKQFKEDPL